MKPIRFTSVAERELLDAIRYYDAQAPELGLAFLERIELAAAEIARSPDAAPMIAPGIRKRLLRRFPYALLYREYLDEAVIFAVMHMRRRPNYWMDRL